MKGIHQQVATQGMTEKQALSVPEFCSAHGISKALFYLQVGRGSGPRTMKVGRRTLIAAEAAVDWRRAMERAGKPLGSSQERDGVIQPDQA